jgi:hypothetical protein
MAVLKLNVKQEIAADLTKWWLENRPSKFCNRQSLSAQPRRHSVLMHPKRVVFAFRTALCDRSRDRPREMLYVSAGSAFPAERPQFGFAREKCYRTLRVTFDFLKNVSETVFRLGHRFSSNWCGRLWRLRLRLLKNWRNPVFMFMFMFI